jgi:predicted chitinase
MSVLSRWRGKLAQREALLRNARRVHEAHPTVASRAKLELRKRQVAFARRVVSHHAPGPYILGWRSLKHVAPWLTDSQAKTHAIALGPAFHKYGIVTPKRAAAAIAQFAHESAGFRTTTEYASGAAYEGRRDLGNTHQGDGTRFKGRGYIQVTGRGNATALARAFGVDFVNHPDLMATPKWAAMVSAYWWKAHGCNELADRGDFTALTRRINGGTNGLADRQAYWRRALQVANGLVPHQEQP